MKDPDYCDIKDLHHTLLYHAFHLHDVGELSPRGCCSGFFLCRETFSFLSVAFHCSLRALRHILCDFSHEFIPPAPRPGHAAFHHSVYATFCTPKMLLTPHNDHAFYLPAFGCLWSLQAEKPYSFLCGTSSHTPKATFVHIRCIINIYGTKELFENWV